MYVAYRYKVQDFCLISSFVARTMVIYTKKNNLLHLTRLRYKGWRDCMGSYLMKSLSANKLPNHCATLSYQDLSTFVRQNRAHFFLLLDYTITLSVYLVKR